jgi:hypothetical protein
MINLSRYLVMERLLNKPLFANILFLTYKIDLKNTAKEVSFAD